MLYNFYYFGYSLYTTVLESVGSVLLLSDAKFVRMCKKIR